MSNGLSQEAALVGKITEYQSSVKVLVGTQEEPVNFNLLTPGVYVFEGYISATAAGKTITNTKACPKELLLVREPLVNIDTGQGNGLVLEIYGKVGYLFHTDLGECIFGNVTGAGVLAFVLAPSSYKFIGEWPEDKKKAMIAAIETDPILEVTWFDNWLKDANSDYATHDYVDQSINDAVTDMATQTYVNDAIDEKLGVIENGSY